MKVYLSYTRETAELAGQLARGLSAADLLVVNDRTLLGSDQSWSDAVLEALRSADAIVFLIGSGFERSSWQQRELTEAVELSWQHPDRPFVPVLVGAAELPAFLRHRQVVRLQDPTRDCDAAVRAVREALRPKRAVARAAASEPAAAKRREEQESRIHAIEDRATANQPTPDDLRAEAARLKQEVAEKQGDAAAQERAAAAARLADILKTLNELEEAVHYLGVALDAFSSRPDGDALMVARMHANLGQLLLKLQRLPEAREHAERALAMYRTSSPAEPFQLATAHSQLASILTAAGDTQGAQQHSREAFALVGQAALGFLEGLPIIGPFVRSLRQGPPAPPTSGHPKAPALPTEPPTPPIQTPRHRAPSPARPRPGRRKTATRPRQRNR